MMKLLNLKQKESRNQNMDLKEKKEEEEDKIGSEIKTVKILENDHMEMYLVRKNLSKGPKILSKDNMSNPKSDDYFVYDKIISSIFPSCF